MEKFVQYVKAGKGRGLIFLLAAAVIISFMDVVFLKQIYRDVEPQIMLAADEILPITVQEGKVVDPVGAYKRVDLKFGDKQDDTDVLPVVLDTREEKSTMPEAKTGIFVMTDVVYMISPRKIERFYLPDGVWDKDEFKKYVDSFVSMLSLVVTVIMVCFFFLFMFLKTLLVAWLSKVGLKTMQKADLSDFAGFMRLSAIVVAILDVVFVVSGLCLGFSINLWIRGLIAVVIVMGVMLKLEEQNA